MKREHQITKEQEIILEIFHGKMIEFLESFESEEVPFAQLVQECLGFAMMYIYTNADDPDQVDWFVKKMKQIAMKEREEILKNTGLSH